MNYYCKKIDRDFILDGNVQKEQWQVAKKVELVDTVTGKTPKQSTEARLLWSKNYLYIAFICHDDYIHATMNNYNDRIYEEEVVEVFIDAGGGRKNYLEFEVNPLNALLHYFIYNNPQRSRLSFGRIDSPVKTAVMREDQKGLWSVEIAIPFTEFPTAENIPPIQGDKWLMNLYRIDRPQNGEDEYSAWSPTGAVNYHCPESFGELVFE